MSIIFEALRKIESEREGGSTPEIPLSFAPPEGDAAANPRGRRLRRAIVTAALTLPLLILVALIAAPRWWGSLSPPSAPARTAPSPASPPVIKEVLVNPKGIRPFAGEASISANRLPPAPLPAGERETGPAALPDLRLKGVSRGTRRSWAFINDKMLKVGDTIEGAEVVEILADRVKLSYRGVEFMLTY